MENIYNWERSLEGIIRRIDHEKAISVKNKAIILKFKEECFAQNIGLPRIIKCLSVLKDVAIWLNKDFDKCSTDDLKTLVAKIEVMNRFCARTKVDYRGVIKKFFAWQKTRGLDIDITWVKTSFKKHNEKLPSELLTEEDILKIINSTKNPRDRAIISSLYESGCRIGEFLKIRIKEVIFEKPGCVFIVQGKTGGRRVRLISSEPYIREWINKHPENNDSNSPLWISLKNYERLEYAAFCKILRVAVKRTDVNKKVNPHNFRHARATYLAGKLTEQQLKVFFGWTRGSDMASVYVHLSGKDVDDALLEIYGIKQDNDRSRESKLKPRVCSNCKTENEASNKFCKLCGSALEEKVKTEVLTKEFENLEANSIMNLLMKDKDVLALIAQKIKEVKI